jgi:hypothetical protein
MTEVEDRTEIVEERATTAPPVVTPDPYAPVVPASAATSGRRVVRSSAVFSPSAAEVTRRVIVFLFGLIQVVISLRILLLLLGAQQGNALVRAILDISQIFVAPFEGILRTDALKASGSILDVTAIVALVGWTVLELIVIWAVNVFRREPY